MIQLENNRHMQTVVDCATYGDFKYLAIQKGLTVAALLRMIVIDRLEVDRKEKAGG